MTTQQSSSIREQLGLLAGHASMCWQPSPSTQVFDTTEATKAVDEAYNEITRILESGWEDEDIPTPTPTDKDTDFTDEPRQIIDRGPLEIGAEAGWPESEQH
jgi:hypothetical protein